MRVLIASSPHRDTFGYSMPPPGVLRLGGALERAGVAVELDDLAYRMAAGELPANDGLADAAAARLLEAHARERCAAIGLSVMGATLPIALAILERLRRADARLSLWIGGPGTTGVERALLERFFFVDVVARGEAEETVIELARALERGSDLSGVAGILWRDAGGAIHEEAPREPLRDLELLPRAAWHLLPPIAAYKRITGEADGLVPIDSGRGCVYDCSFCTIGRFWSRRSRVLPTARLADEIAELRAIPAAKHAYLCHDIFGANREHALELCDELERRALGIPWEVRARGDHLDRELLQRMGAAGCYRVLLGIESADPAVRRRNQKGMRDDADLLRVVDECAAAGIVPILSLILGLPGEDERSLRATLDWCAQAALRAGVQLSLHLVNPQPGCALGEEFGADSRAVEGIPPDMALGAGETRAERELIAAHPDLFTTWTLLPQSEKHLRDLAAIAQELPEVLMRYPKTFAALRERGGLDTLELYREWKRSGRSFEALALIARDTSVRALLELEQAQVRVAARGLPAQPARGPRFSGELLRAGAGVLAVVPTRKGVQVLKLGESAAAVLLELDGERTQAELEREHPGIEAALARFLEAGLLA
ncbi:MAG: B12-binding domain-containing radical SAM protein [Planctomycetes bacterium]|nr:B12-binding domain-containing radical SAM protein [Planctomycetota bacterium]